MHHHSLAKVSQRANDRTLVKSIILEYSGPATVKGTTAATTDERESVFEQPGPKKTFPNGFILTVLYNVKPISKKGNGLLGGVDGYGMRIGCSGAERDLGTKGHC